MRKNIPGVEFHFEIHDSKIKEGKVNAYIGYYKDRMKIGYWLLVHDESVEYVWDHDDTFEVDEYNNHSGYFELNGAQAYDEPYYHYEQKYKPVKLSSFSFYDPKEKMIRRYEDVVAHIESLHGIPHTGIGMVVLPNKEYYIGYFLDGKPLEGIFKGKSKYRIAIYDSDSPESLKLFLNLMANGSINKDMLREETFKDLPLIDRQGYYEMNKYIDIDVPYHEDALYIVRKNEKYTRVFISFSKVGYDDYYQEFLNGLNKYKEVEEGLYQSEDDTLLIHKEDDHFYFDIVNKPNLTKEEIEILTKKARGLKVKAKSKNDFVIQGSKLVKYVGEDKKVHIPGNITEIGDDAFKQREDITEVFFPEGLESIGECAFYYCNKLKTIHFNDRLKEIGKSAFEDCKSLTTITLPKQLVKINDRAFDCCSKLKEIVFNDKLKQIGQCAFQCCAFKEIILPDNLVNVGLGAFRDNRNAKRIVLSKNMKNVGSAFENCLMAEEIIIPIGVETLDGTFKCEGSGNNVLKELRLPEGMKTLDCFSLYGLNIASIYIPKSVKHIDHFAFYKKVEIYYDGTLDEWHRIAPYISRNSSNQLAMDGSIIHTKDADVVHDCYLYRNEQYQEKVTLKKE